MDNRQTKEILARYRPEDTDALDPEMREALDCVQQDPGLTRWHQDQQRAQNIIRRHLREIPLPSGLKDQILAGRSKAKKVTVFPPTVWLALAASVAIMAGLWAWWPAGSTVTRFAAYQQRMVRTALRDYRMDILTNNLTVIRAYLQQQQAQADYVLTPPLERLPGFGAKVLSWQGEKVAMVCFDLGQSKVLYLFIAQRNTLPDAPVSPAPAFKPVNKLMTASWSLGDKTYLLAADGSQEFLQRFF